jgi:hypothetical protein
MSVISFRETFTREKSAAYGGFADAIGGIATVVLAVIGLAGTRPQLMVDIATIIFGAAMLVQGGALLSEYAGMTFPSGTRATSVDHVGGSSLSSVFLVGGAGIVLGILALLGIHSEPLTSIALIAFGTALVLSSRAVWHLYMFKHAAMMTGDEEAMPGSEMLASEMASGSAGIQALTGLAAVVLGILALAGTGIDSVILILVALLALGATIVLTGSTLGGTVMRFIKQETPQPSHSVQTSSSTRRDEY